VTTVTADGQLRGGVW